MLVQIAVLLLQASAPAGDRPVDAVCYASQRGEADHVFAITKGVNGEFASKGLRQIDCPAGLTWTAETAIKNCAFLAHYDEEQRIDYEAYYGFSPDEICEEGRVAAGLPRRPS